MDKKWAIMISALLAFTPVVLPQIFTYYVDGIMGICFVIELFLLMIINPKEKIDKMTCINLISICALFVNLKFTGLVCSGVIAAIYYFYWLIANRKEKNFKYIFKRVTILFVIVFSIAIFVVGSNSYVKNTIDHHMPLYPLMGEGKVDIMTKNEPKAFQGKSNLEKFTISLFSKTENVTYSMEPTKKLPIRVYRAELDAMFIPDIRIGGFGPLFALIFIITILLFIPLMVLFYKNEKQNIKYILLPLASILITRIMVGESWWARYVPQLYFIPVGTLLLAIYGRKYFGKKLMKLIPYIILIPIVLNISCFIYTEYMQLKSFREITADINTLKIKGDAELKPTVNDLYGYLYTLNDNKVKYILVDELDEEERFFMYSWRLEVKRYD